MEQFIERMIAEHKALVKKISKLHAWVYGEAHEKVDAVEFANECIQLKAMKVYEEALRARLNNRGVIIDGGEYLVAVTDFIDKEDESDNADCD